MSELSDIVLMLAYKSLSASERDAATAYAGPDKSFPLYANGAHLKAAWDLAGHAADPAAVRAKIRAFANEHGLSHMLPDTAQTEAVKKAVVTLLVAKARSSDIQQLFDMAFQHESMEGDTYQKGNLVRFAKQHDMLHLLPDSAHAVMHSENVAHEHDGISNDAYGQHEHPVARDMVHKAFASMDVVMKASVDGGVTVVEGWVSTPDPDLEKDVTLPEAFLDSADDYARRGMPLSSEHNTSKYPVGHGQHIAIVRDGQILKAVSHPSDPADFEHFPHSGTGVYGRYAITEPQASGAVRKGNVRSFSYIAQPVEFEPLPTGGKKYTKFQPWLESTIAAYPVNGKAVMTAAN